MQRRTPYLIAVLLKFVTRSITLFKSIKVPMDSIAFLNQWALAKSKLSRAKVHDYTKDIKNRHFILEPAQNEGPGNQFYLTTSGKGVRSGDLILLAPEGYPRSYRVVEIEYYDGPGGDTWTALLRPISG